MSEQYILDNNCNFELYVDNNEMVIILKSEYEQLLNDYSLLKVLKWMGDSPNCCGTDLIYAKTNTSNITYLAYYNPNDFGYHLIENLNTEYTKLKCNEEGFSNGKDNVKNTLRSIYNNFHCETFESVFTDKNGNKHYKINDKYKK